MNTNGDRPSNGTQFSQPAPAEEPVARQPVQLSRRLKKAVEKLGPGAIAVPWHEKLLSTVPDCYGHFEPGHPVCEGTGSEPPCWMRESCGNWRELALLRGYDPDEKLASLPPMRRAMLVASCRWIPLAGILDKRAEGPTPAKDRRFNRMWETFARTIETRGFLLQRELSTAMRGDILITTSRRRQKNRRDYGGIIRHALCLYVGPKVKREDGSRVYHKLDIVRFWYGVKKNLNPSVELSMPLERTIELDPDAEMLCWKLRDWHWTKPEQSKKHNRRQLGTCFHQVDEQNIPLVASFIAGNLIEIATHSIGGKYALAEMMKLRESELWNGGASRARVARNTLELSTPLFLPVANRLDRAFSEVLDARGRKSRLKKP